MRTEGAVCAVRLAAGVSRGRVGLGLDSVLFFEPTLRAGPDVWLTDRSLLSALASTPSSLGSNHDPLRAEFTTASPDPCVCLAECEQIC
ncbi:MAG: hypothetical protein RIS35_1871 [Pseudomonadota bacterium]|jgi:hypothetical protein